MDKKRAVVVGAGIAGIASAIRLSVNGYIVTIFEKNSRPGGKISEFRADGFRFDTGPSLFTLPELVDELFTLCGKNPRDYFNYSALDNSCRYHYPDGTKIISWTDRERFAGELQDKTGEPAENTLSFLNKCRELYELTANVFIFSAFSKMKNLMTEESKKVARNFRKLDAFNTMHDVIKKHFRDERVRQLFGRYATYNGSNPYKAPGTLNVIPHLEHNTGAWFPEKGMYSVVEALVKLAGEQGIAFVYNSYVKEILTEGDMVTGIVCSDGFHEADVVVSDSDIVPLYRKLMRRSIPLWYSSRDRSTSALIFYWGVEGSFPQFDLHNIFFSSDYPHEFRCMEKGLITADPTIYLFISSRKVISDAPAGCENWFVMINVPENRGQDWEKLISEARKNIIARLTRETGIDIGSIIKTESILDPILIEEKTLSHQGSLYGSSSNSMFSAFRRHPNHRNKYKNLLFTGGSVHPGGGIPLCLASARIAVDLLKDNQ